MVVGTVQLWRVGFAPTVGLAATSALVTDAARQAEPHFGERLGDATALGILGGQWSWLFVHSDILDAEIPRVYATRSSVKGVR